MNAGPLSGLIVVDLTRVLSGPYCTMVLGDLGARVIKVEHPVRGDDTRTWGPPFVGEESAYFLSVNRNKESLTLDFAHPRGRAVLEQLMSRADVLVENFRPGTLEKRGFGAQAVMERYSRLIYCSISGYGQTGPRSPEPGYDAVIQAEGGLMSITGPPGGPNFRLGVAISDITAGLFAAQGILAALLARERTGVGQLVDIGMLDATAALLTYQAGILFATGASPTPLGNRHPTIVPYETFATSDGELVVAVGNEALWIRFCAAVGLDEMARDPRFATNRDRVANYEALAPTLRALFSGGSRGDWIDRLTAAGVPCGSVRTVAEVFEDPQMAAREMVRTVPHATAGPLRTVAPPTRLSRTPATVRCAPPTLGQHTEQVLAELGHDDAQVAQLRADGVI